MLVRGCKGSFDQGASYVGNLSSDNFFKQCDRVGKKIYIDCNLAVKPLLEFLSQIKCERNKVTEELHR